MEAKEFNAYWKVIKNCYKNNIEAGEHGITGNVQKTREDIIAVIGERTALEVLNIYANLKEWDGRISGYSRKFLESYSTYDDFEDVRESFERNIKADLDYIHPAHVDNLIRAFEKNCRTYSLALIYDEEDEKWVFIPKSFPDDNKLGHLQDIVKGPNEYYGLIEPIPYFPQLAEMMIDCYGNENAKLIGLPPLTNVFDEDERRIDVLCGNFVFIGYDDEGDFVGLKKEQMETVIEIVENTIDKWVDITYEQFISRLSDDLDVNELE